MHAMRLQTVGTPDAAHACLTYDFENLILAVATTLRLLSQPKGSDERLFYRILGAFLWVYAVSSGIYNHISEGHSLDILVDVPFLFLVVFAIYSSRETHASCSKETSRNFH